MRELQMAQEASVWDEEQIDFAVQQINRLRQLIIHLFPDWIERQAPHTEAPDVVATFKHRMVNLTGKNLKKLKLDMLAEKRHGWAS